MGDGAVKIYYDTEFIEDGRTIDLISIGMVRESGEEYYAISSEFDFKALAASPWLMDNVWPSLPKIGGDHRLAIISGPSWPRWLWRPERMRIRSRAKLLRRIFDIHHPSVKPRAQIAAEVHAFLVPKLISFDPADRCELWADYGAYDHVVLAQLFGPMINLAPGIPMWTADLQQEAARLGLSDADLPQQQTGQHDALADARHNLTKARFLAEYDDTTEDDRG
jgi:hypothetical protein